MRSVVLLLTLASFVFCVAGEGVNRDDAEAKRFIAYYNREMTMTLPKQRQKEWELETAFDKRKQKDYVNLDTSIAIFKKAWRSRAMNFDGLFMSYETNRRLSKIKDIGVAAQPDQKKVKQTDNTISAPVSSYRSHKENHITMHELRFTGEDPILAKTMSKMNTLFTKQQYNFKRSTYLSSDAGARHAMAASGNQMFSYGPNLRYKVGKGMKKLFATYVDLSNEAVKFLGYNDLGELWRSHYESDNLIQEVQRLFKEVMPLYLELHAFVRMQLKQHFGRSLFPSTGHIPESILGGLLSDDWEDIYKRVAPFKNNNPLYLNFKDELIWQKYTVREMFKTAEDFYTSLGFNKMVPTFWNRSIFERPYRSHMSCQASSWDFFTQNDFRVKMCANVDDNDFFTMHHEMGHIAYFKEYSHQPIVYREGANEAFHEAIGDAIGLSVQTPEYLNMRGFIDKVSTDFETDINMLMKVALKTVAYIPFAYLVEVWRWSVFNGSITPDTYMKEWYRLRCQFQGISPLGSWSEKSFHPGAIHHVANNIPYLRYFFSFFLQFQFHKAACKEANYKGPLHRCNIYKSTEAGRKLREMMQLGSSLPWQAALQRLTGQITIDSKPLLEYFQPLLKFLRRKNKRNFGWKSLCPQ